MLITKELGLSVLYVFLMDESSCIKKTQEWYVGISFTFSVSGGGRIKGEY